MLLGKKNTTKDKTKKNANIVTRSLKMKKGYIPYLSGCDVTPLGLLDPWMWSLCLNLIFKYLVFYEKKITYKVILKILIDPYFD